MNKYMVLVHPQEKWMEKMMEKVAAAAEKLYRSGKMHCAEAVLATVVQNYMPEVGDEIARPAAGFGGGSGAGCICGAVVGGTMAFGFLLAPDRERIKKLTKELHRWFREEYGSACCSTIVATHKKKCPELTGKVAGKAVGLLGNACQGGAARL